MNSAATWIAIVLSALGLLGAGIAAYAGIMSRLAVMENHQERLQEVPTTLSVLQDNQSELKQVTSQTAASVRHIEIQMARHGWSTD